MTVFSVESKKEKNPLVLLITRKYCSSYTAIDFRFPLSASDMNYNHFCYYNYQSA